MNTLNLVMDLVGFAAGIISAVFLYIAYKYGPGLYRGPMIKFFLGLLLMSFSFLFSTLGFTMEIGDNTWTELTHHFLIVISLFFFVDGARNFFRIGR